MISLFLVISLGNDNFSGGDLLGSSSSRVPSRPSGGVEERLSDVTETEEFEEEVGATSGVNIEVRVHPEVQVHPKPTTSPSVSFYFFNFHYS